MAPENRHHHLLHDSAVTGLWCGYAYGRNETSPRRVRGILVQTYVESRRTWNPSPDACGAQSKRVRAVHGQTLSERRRLAMGAPASSLR